MQTKALREIAAQKLTIEMDDGEREWADFEGAYDKLIELARASRPCTFPHCSCEQHCDTPEQTS